MQIGVPIGLCPGVEAWPGLKKLVGSMVAGDLSPIGVHFGHSKDSEAVFFDK